MLYERWRHVAEANRNAIALRDAGSGRCWTFDELRAAGERHAIAARGIVHPRGHTPEFILTLLAAWRDGRVVCPLEAGQPEPHVPLPPAGCVHLKITSATTGTARVVAFTGGQLAADAQNIVQTMNLRPEWPNLGVISMAHSYGFSNLVLTLLLHGIPLILVASPLPESVKKAGKEHGDITLPAVPAMWRAWHGAAAIPPGVRLAISAGAPLPLSLEEAVTNDCGLKIHNFYGASECGGIAYDSREGRRTDDADVGQSMCHVRLSVNENGCLCVRSKAVGQSYWPKADAALENGRFVTSDLAELTGSSVFLRGRLSDLIHVAGRKVSPVSIEHELLQHPAVQACLVFGVPSRDADRGDHCVACVVKETAVCSDELRRFLLERLPAWQIPRDWWFVDSLQPNRVGKVSRADWRRRFLARETSG